ncbi:ABC transporter ATP-binding protein [Aggregatilinea lenta]|uniref:ABC transporter ATP-binding protein n=1 Tax=Aggregatilinea lenta TaxID=913108 RepID=UPI000E5B1088|nr:ABC transporter ATP-binding protein [Aggregatilinea lenta]
MSLSLETRPAAAASTEALLSVEHAVKTFSVRRRSFRRVTITAVDDVNLHVGRGEMVGLVGESGSGKSTLGRAILNLSPLDSGQVRFDGQRIEGLTEREFRPLRSRLQMVFQNPATSFNPTMTIGQTLVDAMRLLADASAEEKRHRAMLLLDRMQLDERFASLYPYEMSGGQLQRVALARALAPEPEFIFLDEPTAALDMSIRGQIINLLLDLQRQNHLSFVFVSHDLRVIRYVSDRVVVMYLGQVVETGPKQQIFETPRHPYTQALLAATVTGRDARQPRQRRAALRGEAVTGGVPGCKLYGRCPFALPRCADEPQGLIQVQPDHWVRCWRTDDIGTTSGPLMPPD